MGVKVVSAPACYGSTLGQALTNIGRDRPYRVFSMEMGVKVVSAPVCYGSSLCQVLTITGMGSRKCFLWKCKSC